VFAPGKPFQPSLMFVLEGAYPRVEHLKGASLRQAPALTANIRLGWKGLAGTNTRAYYKNLYITTVKVFIVQAPWPNAIKYFSNLPQYLLFLGLKIPW
jgi:hypothetical protein